MTDDAPGSDTGQGGTAQGNEAQAATPGTDTPHTRVQRLYRFLFRFLGPAQVGPPPYATPEEARRWEASRRATAGQPAPSQAPPGYRILRYTDDAGTVHHSIVRDDARESE